MSQSPALLARFPILAKAGLWPRAVQLGVAASAVAVLAVVLLWARHAEYRVLFSNLSDRDGGAIITALTQMNVPYSFADNGQAILIPADKVYETRLRLAEQGLPRNGDTGFALLDNARFGASQFTEQVNYQRALEGELVHSITAMQAVQHARVHLAIPRESLFVRDRHPPTASVLVTLYPGRQLSDSQIAAITWLVSSSVPHLTADKVSVVDQNGRLLTSNGVGGQSNIASQHEFVNHIEQRAAERITALLTPLLGAGNVRAQVHAQVDFSQREHTSESFGPNQLPGTEAVRSKQTVQSVQQQATPAAGIPGALSNQPPALPQAPLIEPETDPQADRTADGLAASSLGTSAPDDTTLRVLSGDASALQAQGDRRHEATINYELDRTIHHVKEPVGRIERLSAAVVVNYRLDNGERLPLTEDEMASIENLVRQAMGFDPSRGDTLSVVNSFFSDDSLAPPPFWHDPLLVHYAWQLARYLILALLAWLMWRHILKPLIQGYGQISARRAADEAAEPIDPAAQARLRASELNRHEDNLKTARSMAAQDPRAVAMVVRSWMDKDGNR